MDIVESALLMSWYGPYGWSLKRMLLEVEGLPTHVLKAFAAVESSSVLPRPGQELSPERMAPTSPLPGPLTNSLPDCCFLFTRTMPRLL
jgi:hypothetical protein